MRFPPFQQIPFPFRLFILLLVFAFNIVLFTTIASLFLSLVGFDLQSIANGVPATKEGVNASLFLEAFSEIGGFLFTALLFAQLESPSPNTHLRVNYSVPVKMVVLAVIATLAAQFFVDYLVTINSKIPLPSNLTFLKEQEKKIADFTNTVLSFKSFGQFAVVAIVLAVIPAIAEEFFFRGLLLGDLLKEKVSPAIAIGSSAIIFAVAHFEFQNTLAILVLGVFLGYLYYISGSIWLSIAAHLTNNFFDVLLKYLYNTGVLKEDLTNAATPIYLSIAAFAVFALCLYVLNLWKQPADFEYESLSQDPEPENY